jgi:hypothetical protein
MLDQAELRRIEEAETNRLLYGDLDNPSLEVETEKLATDAEMLDEQEEVMVESRPSHPATFVKPTYEGRGF